MQSADGAWWEVVKCDGTCSYFQTAVVSKAQEGVRTTGYASPGDGGGAVYTRTLSEPSHPGKWRDVSGEWFELEGTLVTPQQFGAYVGITGIDATLALQDALDYLEYRGGGRLRVPYGTYEMKGIVCIPSNVTIDAEDGAVFLRSAEINAMFINKSDGTVGGTNANRNIHIRGGIFNANGNQFTSPVTHIAFGHCHNVSVKNAEISNGAGPWHAVEFNAVSNGTVSGCTFYNGGGGSVNGEAIQIDASISGGPFPWFGPYDDTACTDILIENNSVDVWSTAVGSHSVPINPGTRHTKITIRNNNFRVTHCGVNVLRWTDVTIEGNRIFGIEQSHNAADYSTYGIQVRSDTLGRTSAVRIRNNVVDNFIRGRNVGGNSRGVIVVGDPADLYRVARIWVSENYVLSSGRHAVGMDYCADLRVTDNSISNQEQVGIYLYGSAAGVVSGNRVEGRVSAGAQDINVSAAGVSASGGHIVRGNNAPKIYCDNVPVVVIEGNISAISVSGASPNGQIGPNLVNGAWI